MHTQLSKSVIRGQIDPTVKLTHWGWMKIGLIVTWTMCESQLWSPPSLEQIPATKTNEEEIYCSLGGPPKKSNMPACKRVRIVSVM